jgi:putative transcriptional regulator
MIVNELSIVMGAGRMNITELSRRTGLAYLTCHRMYSDKTLRVDFDTLDALCRVLNVGVSDILEYQPTETASGTPDPPPRAGRAPQVPAAPGTRALALLHR